MRIQNGTGFLYRKADKSASHLEGNTYHHKNQLKDFDEKPHTYNNVSISDMKTRHAKSKVMSNLCDTLKNKSVSSIPKTIFNQLIAALESTNVDKAAIFHEFGIVGLENASLQEALHYWRNQEGTTMNVLCSTLAELGHSTLVHEMLQNMQKMLLFLKIIDCDPNGTNQTRIRNRELSVNSEAPLLEVLEGCMGENLASYLIVGPGIPVSRSTKTREVKGRQITLCHRLLVNQRETYRQTFPELTEPYTDGGNLGQRMDDVGQPIKAHTFPVPFNIRQTNGTDMEDLKMNKPQHVFMGSNERILSTDSQFEVSTVPQPPSVVNAGTVDSSLSTTDREFSIDPNTYVKIPYVPSPRQREEKLMLTDTPVKELIDFKPTNDCCDGINGTKCHLNVPDLSDFDKGFSNCKHLNSDINQNNLNKHEQKMAGIVKDVYKDICAEAYDEGKTEKRVHSFSCLTPVSSITSNDNFPECNDTDIKQTELKQSPPNPTAMRVTEIPIQNYSSGQTEQMENSPKWKLPLVSSNAVVEEATVDNANNHHDDFEMSMDVGLSTTPPKQVDDKIGNRNFLVNRIMPQQQQQQQLQDQRYGRQSEPSQHYNNSHSPAFTSDHEFLPTNQMTSSTSTTRLVNEESSRLQTYHVANPTERDPFIYTPPPYADTPESFNVVNTTTAQSRAHSPGPNFQNYRFGDEMYLQEHPPPPVCHMRKSAHDLKTRSPNHLTRAADNANNFSDNFNFSRHSSATTGTINQSRAQHPPSPRLHEVRRHSDFPHSQQIPGNFISIPRNHGMDEDYLVAVNPDFLRIPTASGVRSFPQSRDDVRRTRTSSEGPSRGPAEEKHDDRYDTIEAGGFCWPCRTVSAPEKRGPREMFHMKLRKEMYRLKGYGWCEMETDKTIEKTMNEHKNTDGCFIVWKSQHHDRFFITASQSRNVYHFLIKEQVSLGQVEYYLYEGGFKSESLYELVKHYIDSGIKRPLPNARYGDKSYQYEHIRLKRPLKEEFVRKRIS